METLFLDRRGAPKLAYNRIPGTNPALPSVIFLGGFRSDRKGTKAMFLEESCRKRGQAYVRFDYSGHGDSGGRFEDGSIESWRDDASAILDRLTSGPVILIGSSMGGWIGLLLALARPDRVKGFIGIAAAPDFTRGMVEDRFDDTMRESFESRGYADVPNDYSPEPYRITKELIESGNRVCLLDRTHSLAMPVRLLQGEMDAEVCWETAGRIQSCLTGAETRIYMVPDGDHSLSRPQDLDLLDRTLEEMNRIISGYT
jgi:pimeloyl-ACP methyl ester carboxylesterase